jgi:hypothetical protein
MTIDFIQQAREPNRDIAEKHPYEQDAEESDCDSFIDDGDEQESDSEAADMVTAEVINVRNRNTWLDGTVTCPVCRCDELSYVLCHIERQARGLPHSHVLS